MCMCVCLCITVVQKKIQQKQKKVNLRRETEKQPVPHNSQEIPVKGSKVLHETVEEILKTAGYSYQVRLSQQPQVWVGTVSVWQRRGGGVGWVVAA